MIEISQVAAVVTTINSPTEAISRLAKLSTNPVYIVGDLKSPNIYDAENTLFFDKDFKSTHPFVSLLPFNHYSRKMIGYIEALQNPNIKYILDTDDDNIPYDSNVFSPLQNLHHKLLVGSHNQFLNIYSFFTNEHIWPRGLPLEYILSDNDCTVIDDCNFENIGIFQGLADKDADVDAIYRLVFNKFVDFDKHRFVALNSNIFCPFNSQNTIFDRTFAPLLYLPATTSFRFTDILRGIVAQPVVWSQDKLVGFYSPTVYQNRNEHNIFKDFVDELPMYLDVEKAADIALSNTKSSTSISDNLYNIYIQLEKASIVKPSEIVLLENWIQSLQNIGIV